MYYKLKHHGGPIFTQMLSNIQKIRYSRMLWSEDVISLNKKISDVLSQVQFLAQLQQAGGVDPDTFITFKQQTQRTAPQAETGKG